MRILLDKNPNINSTDIWGQTPLSLAVRRDYEAVIKLLREKGGVEGDLDDGETVLVAVVHWHVHMCKYYPEPLKPSLARILSAGTMTVQK